MANKFNTKKWLQIGAYATDALSKGSAGGLGKAIVEADVDLSGRNPSGNPFNEQNTEDAAGQKAKRNRTGKYSTDHPDIYKGRDYDDPEYGT